VRFFSIITTRAIRRGSFTSVKDLTNKIGKFEDRQVFQQLQPILSAVHLDRHSRFNPVKTRPTVRTN
jgi:hypothetical protein